MKPIHTINVAGLPLDKKESAALVVSILVHRLGGTVEIKQAEIDFLAFNRARLIEDVLPETGNWKFQVVIPPAP
jgi:hypothetical protein